MKILFQPHLETANNKNINLFREWFHVVQDLNPTYLQAQDYELAREIYISLGISWPDRNEDELQRLMKTNAPRRIIRHGIDYETAKAFDLRLELAENALLAAGYDRADVVGNWKRSDPGHRADRKESDMNPLERYSAFCKAQSVSIDAQIAAGCTVLIIETSGHQLYLEAMAYIASLEKEKN